MYIHNIYVCLYIHKFIYTDTIESISDESPCRCKLFGQEISLKVVREVGRRWGDVGERVGRDSQAGVSQKLDLGPSRYR